MGSPKHESLRIIANRSIIPTFNRGTMAEEKPAEKKAEKKEGAKTRQASALKRDLQAEKKRLINRSHRATVQTAVRSLRDSVSKKEPAETTKQKLDAIYSLMDKGVKRGVYKANKAARTKSRLASSLAKQ